MIYCYIIDQGVGETDGELKLPMRLTQVSKRVRREILPIIFRDVVLELDLMADSTWVPNVGHKSACYTITLRKGNRQQLWGVSLFNKFDDDTLDLWTIASFKSRGPKSRLLPHIKRVLVFSYDCDPYHTVHLKFTNSDGPTVLRRNWKDHTLLERRKHLASFYEECRSENEATFKACRKAVRDEPPFRAVEGVDTGLSYELLLRCLGHFEHFIKPVMEKYLRKERYRGEALEWPCRG